jgi:hypothetical protein
LSVLNAAAWLGSLLFFTLAIGPAVFSADMLGFLPRAYAGAVAQVLLERYFLFHIICALVGLALLTAECLYAGRRFPRVTLVVLLSLLSLALIGGRVLQPRMKELHVVMYRPSSSPEQRAAAGKTFRLLHGVSQTVNVLAMLGLIFHLWDASHPQNAPRFFSINRFRE